MNVETPQNRAKILVEVAIFIAFALASKYLLSLVIWQYSGPISLVILLILLTLYLRSKGATWRAFGLQPLPGIKAKLMLGPQVLLTFVAFAAAVAPILILGEKFDIAFLTEIPPGVADRWGNIEGNLPLYLLWLGIVWTAAAFGEEMFFRGYLITRIDQVFSSSFIAPFLSVVLAAMLFGYGHMYYQGLRGFVITGAVAIAFGTMFLLFKRNLWPVIIVHGLIDTMTFTAMYLGLE